MGKSSYLTQFDSQFFQILVEGLRDYSLFLLSPDGLVASWNDGARRIKGYEAEEIVGRHFSCFFTEDDRRAGAPQKALDAARRNGRYEVEGIRVRKTGERFWAHVIVNALTDVDGTLMGFVKITLDITRKKENELRIAELNRNLDIALSNMLHGLCLFDASHKLVLSNDRVGEIFDIDTSRLVTGMSFREVLGTLMSKNDLDEDGATPRDVQPIHDRHSGFIQRRDRRATSEILRSGKIVSIVHNVLPDGGWLTTFEDITARRRAEDQVLHLALHDALTGLPNRTHFSDTLRARFAHLVRSRRPSLRIAVALFDLNRFKDVNDRHGHTVGDLLLSTIAERVRAVMRPRELVGRLGADEFVATSEFVEQQQLDDFLARLESCFEEPLHVGQVALKPECSIGIALYPDDGQDVGTILNNADLALRRSRSAPGQTVRYYEETMDDLVRHRRAMAAELWRAIDQHQFVLAYQSQRSIKTNEVTGCEALLRWEHPERGEIQPADFIPLAEECGAINALGSFVLSQACRDAARWQPARKVAVNVSPLQIQPSLPAIVLRSLEESGLPPNRLELEITETTLIENERNAFAILQQIKDLGVTIAIDDFGTGYSSLSLLKSFRFDRIKLDRSFTLEIGENEQALAMVKAIMALGEALSIPVLAEGVETATQLELLRREGCDEAQGFLFGPPRIGHGGC